MNTLLLHGALGTADTLQGIAHMLHQHFPALQVHHLTLPGHGGRPPLPDPPSIEAFGRYTLRYLQQHSPDPWLLIGYSMGGYIGLWLARHHPQQVAAVLTLGTKLQWNPEAGQCEASRLNPDTLLQKAPGFVHRLTDLHGADWPHTATTTAQLLLQLGRHPPLSLDQLSGIRTPVALCRGANDTMVSHDETQQAAQHITYAQLHTLPDTPHPIEQVTPILLAEPLRDLLQRLAAHP